MRFDEQQRCLEQTPAGQCELRSDHDGEHQTGLPAGHGPPWELDRCFHFAGDGTRCVLIHGHDGPHDVHSEALARLKELAGRHNLEACELKLDTFAGIWLITGRHGADPETSHLALGATAAMAVDNLRIDLEPLLSEATPEQLLAELEKLLNMQREEARELMRLAHEELL